MTKDIISAAAVGLAWVVCGIWAYGATIAFFWESFPTLQSRERFRELQAISVVFGLAGPFGMVAVFISSGFAQHGLLFRFPSEDSNDGK